MSATSNVLRPVGMLEKLYTARQALGVYNSVIVTATYRVPLELEDTFVYTTLRAAIPGLLHRHPPLCCYIEEANTAESSYARLSTVDLKDVLEIVSLEQGGILAEKLQELHDQRWPVGPKPLWRLVVMRDPQTIGDSSIESTLHIALVYHHVIGDGLSGIAFHKSLLRELKSIEQKSQEPPEIPDVIRTPDSIELAEPIEKLISFPLSWTFLMKQLMKEYAPRWIIGAPQTLYAGLPTKTLDELQLRSRVRLISIQADELKRLLEASRQHGVSLTSLLTAAIAFALANELPGASRFLGLTPYTLRRISGTSMAEMVNQSSGFETNYPADMLDHIRKASNANERLDSVWGVASYFHTQMQHELEKCPQDNLVGLLPYVLDHVGYYKKKFGKAREATWEISNLGVFEPPAAGPLPRIWELDNIVFTPGAQPLGAAFTVNCVSVRDKPLSITITWQDSVVHEEVIDAVAHIFTDLPHLLQLNDPSKAAETEYHA
ncbi:MAG: hypothetical protein Q9172_007221 [Xanthocarpia lactea]